jgi:P27 family predicted phage terminase small subunit
MAKSAKLVAISNKHFTKKEIEERTREEEKLKGNDDIVYAPPKELKLKREKELYIFLVEELRASNILNNLDIQMLVQTVDSIMKMEDAKKLIKKYGLCIEKTDGSLQKNPAVNIYESYNKIFYQCCMQLGLSPSSRAKLSLINVNTEKGKEDPLLKVLKKNKSGDDK